jgi:hypothetical protein
MGWMKPSTEFEVCDAFTETGHNHSSTLHFAILIGLMSDDKTNGSKNWCFGVVVTTDAGDGALASLVEEQDIGNVLKNIVCFDIIVGLPRGLSKCLALGLLFRKRQQCVCTVRVRTSSQ